MRVLRLASVMTEFGKLRQKGAIAPIREMHQVEFQYRRIGDGRAHRILLDGKQLTGPVGTISFCQMSQNVGMTRSGED